MNNVTLDPRQLGTALAALRLWQRIGKSQGGPEWGIATNDEEFSPLKGDEIDELCERINLVEGAREQATPEEIERARDEYAIGSNDDIEIDEGALVSRGEGGCWVQAWVWLAEEEDEDQDDEEDNEAIEEAQTPVLAAAGAEGESRPSIISIERVASVDMRDIVGPYDAPEQVPAWIWVQTNASYQNRCNGLDGVCDWILNLANALQDPPERLKAVIEEARSAGAAYLLVHQGT